MMTRATPQKIPESVLGVLASAEFDGPRLVLTGQLDRKLYAETNKVLEAAGGKWNRFAKAHVFDEDAADAIEPIILTGEYFRSKQDFGQFDTPNALAERIVDMADVQAGMSVLEPSAGIGNIAAAVKRVGAFVTCWEIDPKRAEKLHGIADSLNVGDFLAKDAIPVFDRVVMNPPFAKQADIHHVRHALKCIKPGGRLVSVMSAGILFRNDRMATEFRALVEELGGSFDRLPDNSFKESGTSVNTCVVSVDAA